LITRNNYYHDVNEGPSEGRGLLSQWFGTTALKSLKWLWTTDPSDPHNKQIAVATTWRPHGLIAGSTQNKVSIEGADQGVYNGPFPVTAVPESKMFHYDVGLDLQPSALKAGYRIL